MKTCDYCKIRPANAGLYTPQGFLFTKAKIKDEHYLCKECAEEIAKL